MVVGQGSSAAVYSAHRTADGRFVAIKLLTAPITDTLARSAFQAECDTLVVLQGGPGIVALHDRGVLPGGQPYLVLELCDTSLAALVAGRGRLDAVRVARIGYMLAQGLHH